MQPDVICKKYALNNETVNFMLQYGWSASQENYCWPLPELSAEKLEKRCSQLQITEVLPLINAALGRIADNAELKHIFYYLHYYWYKLDNALIYGYKLPDLALFAPEDAPLLHFALALSGCEAVEKKFASLNLPPRYAADALKRIAEDASLYSQRIGRWGYPDGGHHWMRFFVEGRLFRIGRFEYMIEPLIMKFLPRVYKHKSTGRIVALCRDGWKLNSEGLQLWRDIAEEPYCTARLEDCGSFVRGIPVNPNGFAEVNTVVELNKDEFELLWNDSDLVPDMHIPPGGNMRLDLCKKSLQQALEFFPAYLGETPKAFSSFSWIFNPDFRDVLPESNLSKFMNELYLMPFSGSSLAGLSFVFGKQSKDWSDYPASNSLQRAFHQLREAGRRLKEGGMFIEADGIKEFGTQYYQRKY